MPQGMPKIDQEIARICKLFPSAERLDFHLHNLVITSIREFRKMMAEDSGSYSPDEVKHG